MTWSGGRRGFLVVLAGGVAAGCSSQSPGGGGGPCATAADGPGLTYCLVGKSRIRVPGGARLAAGQVTLVALDDSSAAILARDAGGLYALSAVCTHACCVVNICGGVACAAPRLTPAACTDPAPAPELNSLAATGAAFLCPCHGSQFRADGTALTGPAKAPLPSLALAIEGDDVFIDLSRIVASSARTTG